MMLEDLKKNFLQSQKKNLEDFFTFLRFQSISADPLYREDIEKTADWLFKYLKDSGLPNVEKWKSNYPTVVFASDLRAGRDKETLLIYCHYDVQPVDPIESWLSPPFEPTTRNGEIYARGAADNKGQCFYTILAIRNILKTCGTLPINLKIIIEGEEESGSIGLEKLLESKKEELSADYLVVVDAGMQKIDEPVISIGARGIVCMQIDIRESNKDLHSGMAGGLAYNPNRALVELLSKLHDKHGTVSIPGFYDEVVNISDKEKEAISCDFDLGNFISDFGFAPTGMEKGISYCHATWVRPTLEINGIFGGYIGTGFKTVIPAESHAKISCRLVPNQDPERIARLVKEFLTREIQKGLHIDVTIFPGHGRGFRTNPNSKIVKIMSESYEKVFQKPCKKILMGGSVPIVDLLSKIAGADAVLVGLDLPSDCLHSPNEHFGLTRLEKGYLTICQALILFSQKS